MLQILNFFSIQMKLQTNCASAFLEKSFAWCGYSGWFVWNSFEKCWAASSSSSRHVTNQSHIFSSHLLVSTSLWFDMHDSNGLDVFFASFCHVQRNYSRCHWNEKSKDDAWDFHFVVCWLFCFCWIDKTEDQLLMKKLLFRVFIYSISAH